MRSANESPPTAREQNAWQDGAFRFERALQSRAYRLDRAEQTRAAHSSPRAQEYAQNARGHRGQDSSQALEQVISPMQPYRTSIFESRSQKVRVGALERKNFSWSNSQWRFCAERPLKISFPPPNAGRKVGGMWMSMCTKCRSNWIVPLFTLRYAPHGHHPNVISKSGCVSA